MNFHQWVENGIGNAGYIALKGMIDGRTVTYQCLVGNYSFVMDIWSTLLYWRKKKEIRNKEKEQVKNAAISLL